MSDILLTEQLSASATPAAGRVVIYPKNDGYLYFKNDTGIETRVNPQTVATAAEWTAANPTIGAGVFGVESDTVKFKIGDGTTIWNSLPYWRYTAEHIIIATTGGTTVLTIPQSRASSMAVTGTLTSNVIIIVPDIMALFVAENLTTGAFTVTFKTAAGTGVVIPQSTHAMIYADGVNVENPSPLGTIVAANVALVSDTAFSVQDMHNVYNSAGVVSAADTDNVLVASGTAGKLDSILFTVAFRTSTAATASLKVYSISATTASLTPPDNQENYVLISYNAGVPAFIFSATDTSNGRTIIKLGAVLKIAGAIHMVTNFPVLAGDVDALVQRREWDLFGIRRQEGAILSEGTIGKSLALTASVWWARLRKYTVANFDSGVAGSFASYYYNGAVWVETAGLTIIDVLNYNNIATGLATLSAPSKFGFFDVYLGISDGEVRIIYGQAEYNNAASAAEAGMSATLPLQISELSYKYVGRVIFQKSAVSIAEALSAFTTDLKPSVVTQHNTLGGLNTGDYLHMTAAEYAATITNKSGTGNALTTNGVGSDLTLARIAGSTYSTIQHWRNNIVSTGVVAGGIISDAGAGNINVTSGQCTIRAVNSHTTTLYFADFPAATGLAIPANTIRYIGVDYNAGTPTVTLHTTDDFNYMTDFPLGVVTNEAGTLYLHTADRHEISDAASHIAERFEHTDRFARDEAVGGIILGETGTRNITVSAGVIWHKLLSMSIAAFNSSTGGNFDSYYRDGASGFTKIAAQTQWPNTQFDNGTGTLATLATNKYAVCWFYLEPDDGMIIMLYGRAEHDSPAAAEAESPPTTVPNRVLVGARIIGKLVFQKSAATASSISSVFTTTFSTTGASNHANLSNLDYASAGHTGFATAAQGALADSALQAAAIGTTVQAYDAELTTWAGVTPGTGIATFLATPTLANFNAALSDADVATGGGTATGTNTGDQTATTVANIPAGSIAATTVQAAINELDTEKATLAGSASQAFATAVLTASGVISGNSRSVFNNTDSNIALRVGVGTDPALTTGVGLEFSYTAPQYKILVYDRGASTYKNFYLDALSHSFGVSNVERLGISATGLAVTGTIKTSGYTVATLPAGTVGDRAYVTDATAPTYLGALTGGGAVVCPVFKNATAWVSA